METVIEEYGKICVVCIGVLVVLEQLIRNIEIYSDMIQSLFGSVMYR